MQGFLYFGIMLEVSDSVEVKRTIKYWRANWDLTVSCIYLFIQNEIKRLYDQLIKSKTSLQQSLSEISGQSIDEQLQVIKTKSFKLT